MDANAEARMADLHQKVQNAIREIHKRIIGDDDLIKMFFTCLLSSGLDFHPHILFEGEAGLGKTILMKTIAQVLDLKFKRVDGNSERMPSDVAGSETLDLKTREIVIREGPVFTNLLFIDEFNRLNGKTRAVLLQPMQEGEVVIGQESFALDEPFMVMGTQNPTSYRNTEMLEPQERDRFMMGIVVDYPSEEEHLKIIQLNASKKSVKIEPQLAKAEVLELRELILGHVHTELGVQRLITRFARELYPKLSSNKAIGEILESTLAMRGSIVLDIASRTYAFLQGKTFVTPNEVRAVARWTLGHRLVPRITLSEQEICKILDDAFSRAVYHVSG